MRICLCARVISMCITAIRFRVFSSPNKTGTKQKGNTLAHTNTHENFEFNFNKSLGSVVNRSIRKRVSRIFYAALGQQPTILSSFDHC